MLSQAFSLISQAFAAAVMFFEKIVAAVGAAPLIIATLGMLFVVSMFLMPLRGAAVSSFRSASMNHIRQSGKKYNRVSGKPHGGK